MLHTHTVHSSYNDLVVKPVYYNCYYKYIISGMHVGGGAYKRHPPFPMEIYQASTSFCIQVGFSPPYFLKPYILAPPHPRGNFSHAHAQPCI